MKKKLLIIIIAVVSVLLVAGIVLLVVLKDDNKPGQNENKVQMPSKGEDEGYYILKENTNEAIYNRVCNEELCVLITGISFLGNEGGLSFNIYPNEQFNKEKNQSGYIKLTFNNSCEKNEIIADYDFKTSPTLEKEIQLTCSEYLNTDKFFLNVPTEDEVKEYNSKHVHED